MKQPIMLLTSWMLMFFCLILFTSCKKKEDLVKSDFATNNEGWTIVGDAQGEFSEASYQAQGGVANGYIYANDDVQGGVWYFSAPDSYLGNKREFYGATLKFSLFQDSRTSKQFASDDIIFRNRNEQITYIHQKEDYPDKNWTPYEIKLRAGQGWFKGGYKSNVLASEEEIKDILSNITQFLIRGEFETGPDTGALDEVTITKN